MQSAESRSEKGRCDIDEGTMSPQIEEVAVPLPGREGGQRVRAAGCSEASKRVQFVPLYPETVEHAHHVLSSTPALPSGASRIDQMQRATGAGSSYVYCEPPGLQDGKGTMTQNRGEPAGASRQGASWIPMQLRREALSATANCNRGNDHPSRCHCSCSCRPSSWSSAESLTFAPPSRSPSPLPRVDILSVWHAGLTLKWMSMSGCGGIRQYSEDRSAFSTFSNFDDITLFRFPVDDYVVRVTRCFGCSYECVVCALVYIDRLIETGLELHDWNVRQLFLTSLALATKIYDRFNYGNDYYARVGSLPTRRFEHMESVFRCLLKPTLEVGADEFRFARCSIQTNGEGIRSLYGDYLACPFLPEYLPPSEDSLSELPSSSSLSRSGHGPSSSTTRCSLHPPKPEMLQCTPPRQGAAGESNEGTAVTWGEQSQAIWGKNGGESTGRISQRGSQRQLRQADEDHQQKSHEGFQSEASTTSSSAKEAPTPPGANVSEETPANPLLEYAEAGLSCLILAPMCPFVFLYLAFAASYGNRRSRTCYS
ncbi:hypothetical protein BESB_029150 [Besnoitia besnoiti]|uniref:Cyclin, N-terminal domain-containing protein n=1 Tax=Besnoitia besnoiti TaxID=94643 RepID=A0A2A9M7W5_BESBE|nr:uncharacterized protein BESB_029150 [Besnoitia besnoiti]PFH31480.1 hypothetical protein BESB_029150 [Besnoitia besnoiti]